jgi:hypothetical protein
LISVFFDAKEPLVLWVCVCPHDGEGLIGVAAAEASVRRPARDHGLKREWATPKRKDVLKSFFTEEDLTKLLDNFETIGPKAEGLLLRFVSHQFIDARAREYAHHGFARRVQTLARCIHNAFEIVPPDTVKVPAKAQLYDAQINIQAAIGNTYGCIDNLAWVWVHECALQGIERKQVGLRKQNKQVRATLSAELCSYLDSLEPWFDYLVDYRDALAHRIPLYIPPGTLQTADLDKLKEIEKRQDEALKAFRFLEYERLKAEESELYSFQPVVGHSFAEMRGVVGFHTQMICDFLTVEEIGEKMLSELGGRQVSDKNS